VPFLLSLKVGLYHGAKLLTQWSHVQTRAVPFSFSPRFNQDIKFPGIRISSLPLETKLCFNIVVHSQLGQQQVIGSAYIYLFDENLMYRDGISQLNVWPFCKVDPRLSCMNQYWGLRSLTRPKDLNEFVQKEYGKVMVQIDRFSSRVRWSLRDHKVMEELGFPRASKNNEYYMMKLREQPQLMKTLLGG
jgi:phosphatidylinositol-4,5-bisphosphate 3-kinase